jgi:hypothetical protein
MSKWKKENGLYIPEVKKEDMPRFSLRTFTVYYESDVEKFQKLVESKNGIWEGSKQVNFLNYKNQPVTRQYVCIYHYYEDLEMEVLC